MRIRFSLLLAFTVAFSGCGGDDKDAAKQAAQLYDAICDAAFRCCDRGEVDYLFGGFTDEENCNNRLRNSAQLATTESAIGIPLDGVALLLPNVAVLQRAIDNGKVRFDSDMLAACKAKLRDALCNQEEEVVEEPEGCVVPEPVEENPCDLDNLVEGRVGEGGECSSPNESFECKDGFTCAQLDSLGVLGACVRLGQVGDFCFDDNECEAELYCGLSDGTCAERALEGESCAYADSDDPSPPEDTQLIKCVEGLSCDPVTETCVGPCKRGASCQFDEQCDDDAGLICLDNQQGTQMGRCGTKRLLGQPCLDGSIDDCEDDLRCAVNAADATQFLCQERLPNGEDCTAPLGHGDCASGYCDGALCQPSVSAGGDCPSTLDQECNGGYCDTTPTSINCTANGDADCPGTCNTTFCFPVCIAFAADGINCDNDTQCSSGNCVEMTCRTLPMADGLECTDNFQCASGFCNGAATVPMCATLPLADGSPCSTGMDCDSGVCHEAECVTGLAENRDCSSALDPGCRKDLYCDDSLTPATCVAKKLAGAACSSDLQCYGACEVRFGRLMCDDTAPDDELTCDGASE